MKNTIYLADNLLNSLVAKINSKSNILSNILASTKVKNISLLVIANGLLIASAYAVIPFTYVPISLQTLAVFFIALTFAPKIAVSSYLLYLSEGTLGAPVFSGGKAGLTSIFGPTGGYLLGMLFAMMLCSYVMNKNWIKNIFSLIATLVLSTVLIYSVGVIVLSNYVGFNQAFSIGVLPFLIGDLIKIAIICAILPGVWKKFS